MIANNKKRILSIPMWASLLLLPCFLFYFLKSEFQNEKKAITSEKREKVFENIFSQIDTVSADQATDPSSGTNVRWIRDTSDHEVKFKLSYVKDTILTHQDDSSLNDFNTSNINNINVNINDKESSAEISLSFEPDQNDTPYPINDTIIYVNKKVKSTNELIIENVGYSSGIDSCSLFGNAEQISIMQIIDEDNRSSFVINDFEVPNMDVIKNIIPQIILSFFLLTSVWLSFFLFAQSIKRERQLTELRNDFMSNMSHELKTPVSTISVALEALKNFNAANDEELRKEYIDISKSEVDRLGLLVDKALNISLYEQGKFVYEKQIINLDNVIARIIKTLKIQLDNQNVSLEYEMAGHHFFVNSDKTHITNVIHNLIENGIKYSNEPAEISIKLSEMMDTITIEITDKGIGIPSEYQSKIFDKFFRVPKGNTHDVKGHGLGLSYVRDVIESQNGTIKVKSELEKGSTFLITLPKIEAS